MYLCWFSVYFYMRSVNSNSSNQNYIIFNIKDNIIIYSVYLVVAQSGIYGTPCEIRTW